MPYCGRYYALRQKLEDAAKAQDDGAEFQQALTQLRAHAEVCTDCVNAFFGSFPEAQGKTFYVISLIGED